MSTHTSKFEIGDKVVITSLKQQYSIWKDMATLLGVKNFRVATDISVCVVRNYTLHTRIVKNFVYLVEAENGEQYLFSESGLAHLREGEKEMEQASTRTMYKPRAKWVKNTGSKPDLPDGTLVKCVLEDGQLFTREVGMINWEINVEYCNSIVKWKIKDDWNKVDNDIMPDIDDETVIEVKNHKEDGGTKFTGKRKDFNWCLINKWRYAKKD
jgi:hypothetical protein